LTDLFRRFRGLGVAIVVLALSAGVVFATGPLASPSSHAQPNAEEPSEGADEDASEAPETEEPSDDTDEDASEAPETEAPEVEDADDADAAANEDNHGGLVSAAARMDTPEGFANHGAFVSCVAHMKDATLATIDWTTITPEACAAAKDAKHADKDAAKAEKQAAKDAAKAERDAAKAERRAAREAAKAERAANRGG
jgi:hypothetical protein